MFSVINFEELSATRLCEYIQRKLHAEIRVAFDVVKLYIFQDYTCSCNCSTQYTMLRNVFEKVEQECESIFQKEKLILFPLIEEREKNADRTTWKADLVLSLQNYHQNVLQLLSKIQKISHNYTVSHHAAPERKLCVQELFGLEQAIQTWIRLEHNVLFPKMQTLGFPDIFEAEEGHGQTHSV